MMNKNLPCLPGFTFRDPSRDRFSLPSTLVYTTGGPLPKTVRSSSAAAAMAYLEAQNKVVDKERLVELTYGPKKQLQRELVLPKYCTMDKKVLQFTGFFREDIEDWAGEEYRIRPVKVLYYLQNDTMEVIEPKTENSGLVQGTLFKRHAFPHPKGRGRRYMWKDLNLGVDVTVYGISIRLADCDQWTREYLINAGIELNEPEPIPPDPHTVQRQTMRPRRETKRQADDSKLYKFLHCDRKVLRFYGIWQDVLSEPPDMRRVVLQYYLADDTMELLEEHAPNCGRDPFKVLVRKQQVPVDRSEIPENFPLSYMEVKEGDLICFRPQNFRTGKDFLILGKKVFLYDCDAFTRHYYQTRLGVDLEAIAVAEKPKQRPRKVIPPHTGIGTWDDSLQNCLSIVPKPLKKDFMKEMLFDRVALRFKAELITPIAEEQIRRFVVSFHPSDDTVAINEDAVPNSGFPCGPFFKRDKVPKQQAGLDGRPAYYEADDFYVGAEIRVCGRIFKLTNSDPFVSKFMEEHSELYSEDHIEQHKKAVSKVKKNSDSLESKMKDLAQNLRQLVIQNYGTTPCPLPDILTTGCDTQPKEKVLEGLQKIDFPIPTSLVNSVVELCTGQNNETNVQDLRKVMATAFGH